MFIYSLTNEVNGKRYIGQTTRSVEWRWSQHLKHRLTVDFPIYRALRKYGPDNFTVETLAVSCSIECLNRLESLVIQAYRTLAPNGYNLDSGGKNNTVHPDTVKRMSAAHKGKRFTAEHCAKLSNAATGRVRSLATRAKLSGAKRGRVLTIEEYQELWNERHVPKGRSLYCRRGLHLLAGQDRCKECQRTYEKQRPPRIRPPRKRKRISK